MSGLCPKLSYHFEPLFFFENAEACHFGPPKLEHAVTKHVLSRGDRGLLSTGALSAGQAHNSRESGLPWPKNGGCTLSSLSLPPLQARSPASA